MNTAIFDSQDSFLSLDRQAAAVSTPMAVSSRRCAGQCSYWRWRG
jgi:hypothetical protein